MLRLIAALAAVAPLAYAAISSQAYTWKNVRMGAGGGFVPGIVFSTKEKGVAYARTDIGGAYKLNADDTWTPLLDWVSANNSNFMGVDALALDPTDSSKLYLATGLYTNSWDPKNGNILVSTDKGATFTANPLPFKVGGNMPGRGMGERLAVDPNLPTTLFFGARNGLGLYKSTDSGKTWSSVSGLPNPGTYVPDPTDSSGYNSQKIGVSFVTFDSTSGSAGKATPRIFVGVATVGSANLFMSNDGGSTFSALTGTNTSWIPHKGVLSPAEKVLYISTSDGAGPYDGALGGVYRYNITAGTMTNITPVSGGDLYFGFGGLAVDLQKPGTLMVATLNSWWPDANIYRSLDSGNTWSHLWEWDPYPTLNRYYSYDDSLAPWIGPNYNIGDATTTQIGWMIEALVIDPFDSNHLLYGTGATVYGTRNLLAWDTAHNITLKVMADGMDEIATLGLISPPVGPHLLSAVGDEAGFIFPDDFASPPTRMANPGWATSSDIDYAGQQPTNMVRVGTGDSTTGKQVALSQDSGTTWNQDYGAADNVEGGHVALSANADTVLWSTATQGVMVSQYTNAFTAVSSLPATAIIASDKVNNSLFFGAYASKFYVSTNGGSVFTATATLGASNSPVKIVVNPTVSGDVWVSSDVGLFHSTNSGTTFTAISGVTQAWNFALGMAKTTGGYPAIYASAIISGTQGYFRSDDTGATWVRIDDAQHGFQSPGQIIAADPRIYGRVYISGDGRGVFVGNIAGASTTTTSAPTTTTSKPATTTSTPPTTTTSKPVTTTTPPPTTTTSKPVTTTTSKPATTTTSTGGCTTAKYGQCGGSGFTGCTVCASGSTCTVQNAFYSQCV